MRRLLFLAGVLALVALGGPAPAFAQDTRAAIDRGLALRAQNRDAEALRIFEDAYQRDPVPELLAQIALAEAALGRWVQADAHLRQAISAQSPWIQSRMSQLQQALAGFQRHLARLEIAGGVSGAEVRIDGEPVGQLPATQPITIPSGVSTLEVVAPGYMRVVREVRASPGGVARVSIRMVRGSDGPAATRSAAPPAAAASGAGTDFYFSPMLLVGVLTTAVGAIGAVVFGALYLTGRDSYVNDVRASRGELEAYSIATDISLGLAAVGGIFAVISFFADPSGERARSEERSALSLQPWATTFGGGLSLTGGF